MVSKHESAGVVAHRAKQYRTPVAVILALVLAAWAASPFADYFVRLGSDYLTPIAARFAADVEEGPVALVVIDEVTHNTPPFSETPEVAWTPFLGEVIAAVNTADPAVIGLDMIFPKTISGRGLVPGYDRSFLQALAEAGRAGNLVLAEAKLSETPIRPYQGQQIAVGGDENIRAIHLTPDSDNIIRRHPAFLRREDGTSVRSFASELAARAGSTTTEDVLIDYITPADSFPTYRLSDLYQCLQKGETAVFDAFADKVVVIGTALDVEDRHVAANRYQRKKEPDIVTVECGSGANAPQETIYRASTAGAFIEARAAYTFLNLSAPQIPPRAMIFISTVALLAALVLFFFRVGPGVGFALFAAVSALLWVVGAQLLAAGILAPIVPWLIAAGILYVALYAYRFILEDQSKRWITHAFEHYLNPSLVNQLADDPAALKLGGERRRVAILFADLAGFTTTSEEMADDPETLAAHLNIFFEIMAENIEAHDGYIDKFIGDAVMGVWGAPVTLDNPEMSALDGAVACVKAIEAANSNMTTPMKMRIGLSAGDVLAGNLGSKGRFNYTVIGDAVNRAARLEQENKRVGTQILFDQSIAGRLTAERPVRLIEEVQLRGQTQVTKLYTTGEKP